MRRGEAVQSLPSCPFLHTGTGLEQQMLNCIHNGIFLNQTHIYKNFKNQNTQKYFSCENFHEVKLGMENILLFLISPVIFLRQSGNHCCHTLM